MATTNRDRVGAALDLLHTALRPYVQREMRAVYRDQWLQEASIASNRTLHDPEALDITALLSVVFNRWNEVFKQKLSQSERSIVSELREVRNRWAHQEPFSSDDTYRALDSIERLLTAISAPQAAEVQREKNALLRVRFEEQERNVRRRVAATAPTEGQPAAGLKPWREIITPHRDVAEGRFSQAEFAADLGQVHRGEGAAEYRDPREFFRRTFLTEGLRHLLANALGRLDGASDGDPVIKLQTNFGGGKTHSMLALYHLFSGVPAADLPGLESLLTETGVPQPSQANRAILVGTALSPAEARRKPDGTLVHTLWGELAWQLLGAEGYALVAAADQAGVNPGSDILRALFRQARPSLILIDEWVTFVRQLYGQERLPAGSFDANLSFAQSLTEAARATPGTLVVASLPSSDIEVGGDAGREALKRLENTFGRIESVWKPASSDEGFEIVRRRLFEPIADTRLYADRDAAIRAFIDLYRANRAEFPHGTGEAAYERRMQAAYPIHPELFDRLYEDWSTLDRFQRTRGVLRLMATVIHVLWERTDRSLLILPGSLPMDDPAVQYELTRYLEDGWQAVIEKDIDGPNALPLEIDQSNPNLGRYAATRRVARAIYLGSAPLATASNRGKDDRQIRLGCVQPGESPATFGDALRRLASRATYLYTDGGRYWYSITPTVNRLAADRAGQQKIEDIHDEIVRRLRANAANRGAFARVHVAPASSGDVPDDDEVRLVILGPQQPHTYRADDTPARRAAAELLNNRGASPRTYRNMLVFLAADAKNLQSLENGVREFLAWRSIHDERETLNLDAFQMRQVERKAQESDETVTQRIPEAYTCLLIPTQPDPTGPVEWVDARTQGSGSLAERAARKLEAEELLIAKTYGYSLLRMQLDGIPLWRGDDVGVRQLWDDYARYLYLPRLRDSSILLGAIRQGVGRMLWRTESFAYAQRKGEDGLYHGLIYGQDTEISMDGGSVVVKPDIASLQIEIEAEQTRVRSVPPPGEDTPGASVSPPLGHRIEDGAPAIDAPPRLLTRFHGSVVLDPHRVGRDAGQIAQEILSHLTMQAGARVEVTLEIQAHLPHGAPEEVVRTVTENARTLRFTTAGFEPE